MIIESDSITATDSTQVEEEDVNLCSDIVAHNSEVDGDGNVNVELELKYDRKKERVSFLIVQVVIVHVATHAFSVTVGSRT